MFVAIFWGILELYVGDTVQNIHNIVYVAMFRQRTRKKKTAQWQMTWLLCCHVSPGFAEGQLCKDGQLACENAEITLWQRDVSENSGTPKTSIL